MWDWNLWLISAAFSLALGVRPVRGLDELRSAKLNVVYGDVGIPEAFGAFIMRTIFIAGGLALLREWL